MGILVRDGSVWKDSEPYVRDAGIWKPVDTGFVKDGGVWKEMYSSGWVLEGSWETGLEGWTLSGSAERYNGNPRTGTWALRTRYNLEGSMEYTVPEEIATSHIRLSFWAMGSPFIQELYVGLGGATPTKVKDLSLSSMWSYQEHEVSNPLKLEVVFRTRFRFNEYILGMDDWKIEGWN